MSRIMRRASEAGSLEDDPEIRKKATEHRSDTRRGVVESEVEDTIRC